MTFPNKVTVCKQNYKTNEEFENAVKQIVMWLINNDYILTIKYDDKEYGIVWIVFDYANEEYGGPLPYWLTPEEADRIEEERI